MICAWLRWTSQSFNLPPFVSIRVQSMQIIQILSSISPSKYVNFFPGLDIIRRMHITRPRWRTLHFWLGPPQIYRPFFHIQNMHITRRQRPTPQPSTNNNNFTRLRCQRRRMPISPRRRRPFHPSITIKPTLIHKIKNHQIRMIHPPIISTKTVQKMFIIRNAMIFNRRSQHTRKPTTWRHYSIASIVITGVVVVVVAVIIVVI
mmetsp:Transcript_14930/g.19468  ORF Transcript_14930/g.19468 Transcript_14930/m.19468 type:complete len:204 (+) Transcript_14930:1407-2018(+)